MGESPGYESHSAEGLGLPCAPGGGTVQMPGRVIPDPSPRHGEPNG
jgi:hypothetical protein